MSGTNPDRYDGRPFLRLLECYVLWAIDQLASDQAATLESMAPKLKATYGQAGSWPEIVAREMDFPPEMPAHLRTMWRDSEHIAREHNEPLDAETWARAAVDNNFI